MKAGLSKYLSDLRVGNVIKLRKPVLRSNPVVARGGVKVAHSVYLWIHSVGKMPAFSSPKYRPISLVKIYVPEMESHRTHILPADPHKLKKDRQFHYLCTLLNRSEYFVLGNVKWGRNHEKAYMEFYKMVGILTG
jgi:hypothetical protein